MRAAWTGLVALLAMTTACDALLDIRDFPGVDTDATAGHDGAVDATGPREVSTPEGSDAEDEASSDGTPADSTTGNDGALDATPDTGSRPCAPNYADCEDAGACGTLLTSTTNCGACGVICASPTPRCAQGDAGAYACSGGCWTGQTNCSGTCSTVATDPNNCGSCGTVCVLANAIPGCSAPNCTVSSCSPGYLDCDGVASNGCRWTASRTPTTAAAAGHSTRATTETRASMGTASARGGPISAPVRA